MCVCPKKICTPLQLLRGVKNRNAKPKFLSSNRKNPHPIGSLSSLFFAQATPPRWSSLLWDSSQKQHKHQFSSQFAKTLIQTFIFIQIAKPHILPSIANFKGFARFRAKEKRKMRSTIASSFLRITHRISRICPAPRQQQQTFMYSSLVSPPSSSLSKLSLSKLSQNLSKRHPFLQYRFASSHMTRADEKELECAKEFSKETIIGLNERDVQVSDFVKWSKVEIIKYYQEQIIIFEKEDPGEILQVDVYMSQLVGEDDKAKSWETKIPLFVTVKRDGLCLEFCCIASSDDITIDTVLMNGNTAIEGLEFSNFDQNLQRCFYEYLSTRGIKSSFKSSLMHFIKEYARIKRKRENIDMVTESELYP